jgi:hypothetical protein
MVQIFEEAKRSIKSLQEKGALKGRDYCEPRLTWLHGRNEVTKGVGGAMISARTVRNLRSTLFHEKIWLTILDGSEEVRFWEKVLLIGTLPPLWPIGIRRLAKKIITKS